MLENLIEAFTRRGDAAKGKARYAEALAAYQKGLDLADKKHDPKQWTDLATNVALMHEKQAAWKEAEPLYTEILRLRERHYGKASSETAVALNNLAGLLHTVQNGHRPRWLDTAVQNYRTLRIKMGDTEQQAQKKIDKILEPIREK